MRRFRLAVGVGLAMSVAVVAAVALAPRLGSSPIDELYGWSEVVGAARVASPGARLATTHWMALGHLGWYAGEPLLYLSERPSAPTYYAPEPGDDRPLLVVVPDGLGPRDRAGVERLAGAVEERGGFTARHAGRAVRSYRFYLAGQGGGAALRAR